MILLSMSLGRDPPDILTRFASLNPKSDPSPRPSPLRKGRGGIVGSSLASGGSGAGAAEFQFIREVRVRGDER